MSVQLSQEPVPLIGHTDWVYDFTFSPDGRLLVSAAGDHTLKLWSVADGRVLHTLTGHAGTVNSCAFSPDGQLIVSASEDHSLKLWQVDSGHELRTLSGHTNCGSTPVPLARTDS